jgi:hypothetical protein
MIMLWIKIYGIIRILVNIARQDLEIIRMGMGLVEVIHIHLFLNARFNLIMVVPYLERLVVAHLQLLL